MMLNKKIFFCLLAYTSSLTTAELSFLREALASFESGNTPTKDPQTILTIALERPGGDPNWPTHRRAIRETVKRGAKVNTQTYPLKETALTHATQYHDVELTAWLLERGADVAYAHSYTIAHHLPLLRMCVEAGYDVDRPIEDGRTLLHYAMLFTYASSGEKEPAARGVVAYLLEHVTDPDVRDNSGWTPAAHLVFETMNSLWKPGAARLKEIWHALFTDADVDLHQTLPDGRTLEQIALLGQRTLSPEYKTSVEKPLAFYRNRATRIAAIEEESERRVASVYQEFEEEYALDAISAMKKRFDAIIGQSSADSN